MKFLHLIIIIPASLLRLFSEGSSRLQLSSPVEMSAKEKGKSDYNDNLNTRYLICEMGNKQESK